MKASSVATNSPEANKPSYSWKILIHPWGCECFPFPAAGHQVPCPSSASRSVFEGWVVTWVCLKIFPSMEWYLGGCVPIFLRYNKGLSTNTWCRTPLTSTWLGIPSRLQLVMLTQWMILWMMMLLTIMTLSRNGWKPWMVNQILPQPNLRTLSLCLRLLPLAVSFARNRVASATRMFFPMLHNFFVFNS